MENGGDSWGVWEYDPITTSKEYYISQTDFDDYSTSYGTNDVISVVDGSTGNSRFYVMALEDVNSGTRYCWYAAAYGSLDKTVGTTENDFGEGKTNTDYVMEKWNDTSLPWGTHNTGSYSDLWGVIENEYNNGWFVPSKSEWSCFGDVFGITSGNYSSKFGLQSWYWSSSQYNTNPAYYAGFITGCIRYYSVTNYSYARLSTTF